MKTREKLKNLGKRTLSCIMALSMCMSFVPDVPVFAEETTDTEITTEVASYDSTEDTAEPTTKSQTEEVKSTETSDDGAYTVTLDSVDGGEICFYTSDTDTTENVADKRITAGSSVGVKFIPADGYKVSSFTISDVDRNELYRDETSDDVFEFTMPEMDVVVGGSFARTETSSEKDTTEAVSDTENGTTDGYDFTLAGTKVAVNGDKTAAAPPYYEKMKAYTNGIVGKGTNAKSNDGAIGGYTYRLSGMKNSYSAKYNWDIHDGYPHCADFISYAYRNYNNKVAANCSAATIFNNIKNSDKEHFYYAYKNNELVNSDGTTTAKNAVTLQKGDIILCGDVSVGFDENGDAQNGAHIFFIYDVDSDGRVWMADCNGILASEENPGNGDYNRTGIRKMSYVYGDDDTLNVVIQEADGETVIEEADADDPDAIKTSRAALEIVQESGIKDADDIKIALEGSVGSILTVLRYKTASSYPISITKTDGGAANAVSYDVYSGGKKVAGKSGTKTCSQLAATNGYGKIDDAEFTVYKNYNTSTKKGTKVTVYSDAACKTKITTALKRNTTYYVKPDDISDANNYITVVETKAPAGWNGQGTSRRQKLTSTETAKKFAFTDKFDGDPLSITLTKTGVETTKLAGVEFILEDDSTSNRKWTYKTGSNGEIIFEDPSYLVSGTAFMTKDNYIQFFAGHYTLYEKAPRDGYFNKGSFSIKNGKTVYDSGDFGSNTTKQQQVLEFDIESNGGIASVKIGGKEVNQADLTNTKIEATNDTQYYSFSIAKTDGGASLSYNTYTNGKAGADKTVGKGAFVSNNSKYGKLADARFSAYVTKTDGTTVHIGHVYTDPECTTESLAADSTKLVPGKTYYIPKNNLKNYAAANGSVQVSLRESVVPKGWTKASDKTVTLTPNTRKAVTITDTYHGTNLSFSLVKENSDGKTLAGAEYTLTNTSDGRKWVFKTDTNGVVKFYDPAYLVSGDGIFYKNPATGNKSLRYFGGNYTLVETKAPADYMSEGKVTFTFPDGTTPSASFKDGSNLINIYINPLNDGSGKVEVKMNAHEITGDTKAVIVNTAEPHSFVINKTDGTAKSKYTVKTYKNGEVIKTEELSCDDIAAENSLYGRLSDATFTVTKNDKTKTVYEDENCTKEHKGALKAGVTYWMKDTPAGSTFTITESSPKGWSGTGDVKTLTVKEAAKGKASVSFTDRFYGTNFKLILAKQGITGNRLAGAVFKLTCANGNSTNDLYYVTDKNGEIDFSNPAYLKSGRVIFGASESIALFAGNYTLTEVTAPTGYLAKGWYITSTDSNTRIRFNGRVTEFSITSDGDGKAQVTPGTIYLGGGSVTVTETPKVMGFELDKINNDTEDKTLLGGMTDYTTKFEVIYVGRDGDTDDSYAWIDYNGDGECTDDEKIAKGEKVKAPGTDDAIWVTDENGHYSCPAILQTGTYKITEIEPPKGLLADSEYDTFEITFPDDWKTVEDKEIIKIERELDNSMIRGGVAGFKYDYDTMTNSAMAGSSFDGIEFWVENANENAVWLDVNGDGKIDDSDRELKAGEQVQIGTLENGSAEFSTNPTFLPYGNYILYEKQGSNDTYVVPDKYSKEGIAFSITKDMEYKLFTLEKGETAIKTDLAKKYAASIKALGSHTSDGTAKKISRTVSYDVLGEDFVFANKVNRHGAAIVKYDVDEFADVVFSEELPLPQGDGKLTGAEYEVINRNNGTIMVDTNNDHVGDKKVETGGVCVTLKTVKDDRTGLIYAMTNTTCLPSGNYEIREKAPSEGYLNSTERGGIVSHTYSEKRDGAYLLYGSNDKAVNALKQIVTDKYPETDFGDHIHNIVWEEMRTDNFLEPVIRGKVSIKKNDADRKEHKTSDKGMFKGDYDSKYAQGDASLEGAVYDIYNISDSYVYTSGANGNSTLKRYESGKKEFAKLTGIDVDTLSYTDGVWEQTSMFTDMVSENVRKALAENVCYTLTTDGDGNAATDDKALPYGTYLILEKTPSKGYRNTSEDGGCIAKIVRIRKEAENVNVNYDAERTTRGLYETVIRGGFEMYKYDEETLMNVPLGTANLAGTFEVINRSDSYVWVDTNEDGVLSDDEYYEPGAVVFTFKTDEKTGKYISSERLLPYGTYEIHETYPPYGYLHLSDINPELSVYFTVREDKKIVSDGWFYDKEEKKVTSFTHYEPVNAYDEDGNRITEKELAGEKKEVTDARLIIYNYVMRGDLFFEKKSLVNKKKMAFIPFLMKSYDKDGNVIESHIIFTDENGDFNTCADYVDHTYKTNAGDELADFLTKYNEAYENDDKDSIKELDSQYAELTKDLAKGVGTWFGLNTKVFDDLNRAGNLKTALAQTGALPFGTYTIEELRCPNNKNYDMVTDTIIVDTDACETDAVTDPASFKEHKMHSTINFGTIYNSVKGLETVALAKDTQSHMAAATADLIIVDKVSYEGLEIGKRYKMVAELHDSVTGEILLDSFGKEVRVEKEFVAKLTTGSIDMNIEYDATDYKNGGSVTVFEYLYDLDEGGEDPIMKEADKTEENQQIHFPSLDSVLLNGESHMVKAGDDISLVDTITYDGFEAGKTYIISGNLMNYESNDVAVDDDGEIIKAKLYEKTDEITTNKNGDIVLKPSEKSGTFRLLYNFSGKTLSGILVSYIEARSGKTVIAEHKDITDTDQSVYIPSIKTTAVDMASDTHMMTNGGLISIKDTVKYTGLIPGEAYDVSGILMDKETKEPFMVNGEKITGSAQFTPESSDGTVDVIFTFAVDDMQGKNLVVFEELLDASGEIIAEHTDIDDEDQAVYSVKIGTVAKDTVSGLKVINPDGSISITDTVSYKGLATGLTYVFKGYLMDKSTGEALKDKNGKEITAVSDDLTAENADGTLDMTFAFEGYDALAGKNIVVFEEAYLKAADGAEKLIASEKSLDNEDQTVYFPELATTAFEKDSKINIAKAGNVTIIDTVKYNNLVPGLTYKVSGSLVDKETGKTVTVSDKEVTGTAEFTPESPDGTVDVEFTFDAKDFAGKTLVAYERLYAGETLIKSHEKIDDKEETIYFPSIGTTATDDKTGDHMAKADEVITINDKVSYKNLVPGVEYMLVGQLMNKSTNKPIELANATGFEGAKDKETTYVTKMFTPDSADGETEMTFIFDGREYAGISTVAFESVYVNGNLIAEHCSMENTEQTVSIPKVSTTATNKKDGTHYAAGEKTTVVDNVKYSGLIAGKEYEVKGTLMDKETGSPLLVDPAKGETDGNMVTASKKFTAEESDGSVDLEFTFDASLLCGKTIVVFERLYHNDKEIAYHTDINDDEQAVHVVGISTTALDEKTKSHTATYGKTVIIDEVSYDGVIPGTEYVLSGKLMDKSTKKALTNGKSNTVKTLVDKVTGKSNEYVSEIKFTPSSTKGSITVKFEIDTSTLAGKSIVVYEKMYANGKLIAKHEDINSSSQTVTVSKNPKIGTKAYDKASKGKALAYGEKVSVIDTVSYENLEAGKEYTLTGKLVDKSTKKAVKLVSGGKGSKMSKKTVTLTFTPKKSSGTVDMEFVINTKDFAGKSLVAFEYVKLDDKIIAKHEDLSSTSQTVTVPSVSTKATVDGKKVAKRSKNTVIIDSVSYKNIEKGKTYNIKGVLMDKKTKKSTGVTATARFTAKDANGSEDVKFTIDTSKYDELVVFEEIYYGNTLIGEHRDINDKDQAVTFSDTETPPDTVQTGVSSMLMILLMIVLLGGAAGVFFFKKKIK